MVFKRRTPKTFGRAFIETFYPRGGWGRAVRYVVHRLRRLPDPAYKISRGIAAGVFTSFTPFFGFHFLIAGTIAWGLRGNILASLLATFVGNPLTFPIIASISVELGTIILGKPPVPLPEVIASFSQASVELWRNFMAIFTPAQTHWGSLGVFFDRVFLPYLVGGIAPGIAAGLAAYFLSRPLIAAYQRRRLKKLERRLNKARLAERVAKVVEPGE